MRSKQRRRKRSAQPSETLEQRVLLSASNDAWKAADHPEAYIVNGTETNGYKGVGIVNGNCTGTLITSNHVLTAAHCTYGMADDAGYFQVGSKKYKTKRITEHFNYDDNMFYDGYDLSIMELTKPVKNTTPYEIHTEAPQVGQLVTLVGFGRAGNTQQGELFPYGAKREATTTIDEVTARHIRWTINSHAEGSNSFGDSGAPLSSM